MPGLKAPDLTAAGAVVLGPGATVLLVHRPKYDDWAFPKGKLERGEHPTTAAVREVAEETGVRVRLGLPLGGQRYRVRDGLKQVHYWIARAVGEHDVSSYVPNAEIDEVVWVPLDKARRRLTYERDVATLDEAWAHHAKTRAFVVLRHSQARSRKAWRDDDRRRPLLVAGRSQAAHVAPVLSAYDVTRLVSSSSTRCVETLQPYAELRRRDVELLDRLSEEDSTPQATNRLVRRLTRELGERAARAGSLVLCTHRPVLPWVFEALGVDDPGLAPGELVVVHQRKGQARGVERHLVG